ncbi:MAG: DUF2799 domain-containing protein [Gallionella sp.]|nr:DUF2799 domain-containing protein [Gallionella sp.]
MTSRLIPRLSLQYLKQWILTAIMALLLTACQSTMQKIADCKAGDWNAIGYKDGYAGTLQNFEEHRTFCSRHTDASQPADAAAIYQVAWAKGDWAAWAEKGQVDGRSFLPLTQVESYGAKIPKDHAPVNRPAYESGWLVGNAAYWQDVGRVSGSVGESLAQKASRRADAAARQIRFDEAAYDSGWQVGNRLYWQNAGSQDAHNGIADSNLTTRAAAAKTAGLLVQADAYRAAWNAEIPNYWKTLGEQDAVSGKDFAMRRAEAQRSGLKIFEAEYQQSWETRLAVYWTQAGNEDGFGHPFQLEERIAHAAQNRVFVIARTRELYTNAWELQNTRYCNVDDTFARGRRNEYMAIEVCKPNVQGQMKRAYLSGQDYELTTAKHNRAHAEVDEHARRVRDARARLEHINRDIAGHLSDKKRVINAETLREDKQHENERHQLEEQLEHAEHQLGEARRREEILEQQLLKLKRDIY